MSDLLAKIAQQCRCHRHEDGVGTLTHFKDFYNETLIKDAKGRCAGQELGQRQYIDAIKHNDTFGIGPADWEDLLAVVMAGCPAR